MKVQCTRRIGVSKSLYMGAQDMLQSAVFVDLAGTELPDVFWSRTDHQCLTEKDLRCNSILNWKPEQCLSQVF